MFHLHVSHDALLKESCYTSARHTHDESCRTYGCINLHIRMSHVALTLKHTHTHPRVYAHAYAYADAHTHAHGTLPDTDTRHTIQI